MKCEFCGEEFKTGDSITVIKDKPVHGSQCEDFKDCEIGYMYEILNPEYYTFGEDYFNKE